MQIETVMRFIDVVKSLNLLFDIVELLIWLFFFVYEI